MTRFHTELRKSTLKEGSAAPVSWMLPKKTIWLRVNVSNVPSAPTPRLQTVLGLSAVSEQ